MNEGMKEVLDMAHYRIIRFCKSDELIGEPIKLARENLQTVDGFIYNGELVLFDTLRWMLPEMSEEKRRETFMKLIDQKRKKAEADGLCVYFETVLM